MVDQLPADSVFEEEDVPAPPKRATWSWIVYDLANTMFSFVVLSFYYGPWVVDDLGMRDSWVTVPQAVAMTFVVILAPVLGAVSDRGRKIPFLIVSTLVAAGGTMVLGLGGFLGLGAFATVQVAVVVYVVANIGYQVGLVFYDALLPAVSTPKTIGRVGSLGVGIGYIGSFVGLGLGAAILAWRSTGEPYLFLATGIAFLLLSIPCFVFVRERKDPAPIRAADIRRTAGDVWASIRALPQHPALGRFLIARVLYADAVNTTLLILGIYAVTEAGFQAETLQYSILLGLGIGVAVLAAPLWGLLVDRIGPRHTLSVVLLVWLVNLTVVSIHPILELPQTLFYVYGALVGVGLAGVWTSDRPLLVGLVPKDEVGRWFGLYSLAGRFASIIGPLLWSLTVDVLFVDTPHARPFGILVLVAMIATSWYVARRIPDPKRADDPMRRFVPWQDHKPRRPFPVFVPLLIIVSWALFLHLRTPQPGIDWVEGTVLHPYSFHVPDLFQDPLHALATLVTAPWLAHDTVQIVYTTVLLLLFAVPFERHEGTRATAILFAATTGIAALFAAFVLWLLHGNVDVPSLTPILDEAWNRHWNGASVGAFGLMGALAGRARTPWLLLAVFAVWEFNVGGWYLRSYTPAFHLSALALGFFWARYGWKPLRPDAAPDGTPTAPDTA